MYKKYKSNLKILYKYLFFIKKKKDYDKNNF